MARSAPADENDDLDEVLGLGPRSRSARRRSRAEARASGEPSVRPWRDKEEDDEIDDARPGARRERSRVFWRARDSLYFEPLVALAILAVLLVSLFAYTSNWPPVYVVESNSMQHGAGDHIGYLNAGDIVLAQKASFGSIETYVDARPTGFTTYGLLGDVILYYPNGTTSTTPVVHRAIVYLQYNANATYTAVGPWGSLACGFGGTHDFYVNGTSTGCGTSGLKSGDVLRLFNVGGRTVVVNFGLVWAQLGEHSGFITLGDNNSYADQLYPGGPPVLSSLVEPSWVIGVARGMIPWFGAVKLLLDGHANYVPTASWEFLGLTVAGVIFAAAGLHFLLRRRHEVGGPLRSRAEEDLEEPKERNRPAPAAPVRERATVRPWKPADDAPAGGDAAATPRRMSYEQRRRSHFVTTHERRPARPQKKRGDRSDDSEDPGSSA